MRSIPTLGTWQRQFEDLQLKYHNNQKGGDIQVLGTQQKGFEDQKLENHDGNDHLQNATKQGWMPTKNFTITYKMHQANHEKKRRKRTKLHQNRLKEKISLKVMMKKTNIDVHHQLHSMIDKPKK